VIRCAQVRGFGIGEAATLDIDLALVVENECWASASTAQILANTVFADDFGDGHEWEELESRKQLFINTLGLV